MVRYETLILTVPEITNAESGALETQFSKLVEGAKGKLISYERWGKYRLAYPVNKNEYGVYYLTRFDIPSENKKTVLDEIKTMCAIKYNTIVMRHMIAQLDKHKPLDYQRPTPLDDAPKGVDAFLKENKMEGLLGGSRREGRKPSFEVEERITEELELEE